MQGYFAVERAISRSAGARVCGRGGGGGGGGGGVWGGPPPPPLFLDQIEAQRAKKNPTLSPAPYSELLGALDSETRTNENEDFLNTEYCSRVNQRHFGGKTRQPSFYYEF